MTVLYEVWETNADLEPLKLVHQGFVRDIAETSAYKKFKESGFEKDFLVYDKFKREMVSYIFTEKTKGLRGECQG